jgi:glutathione S-transferase
LHQAGARTKETLVKLYDSDLPPNPRKLRVYLKEKGIDVPLVPVDLLTGQNRQPEFLAKNPLGGLPVLELDDGTHLTESLAIIEYFEELHPNPPMIGTTPIERARVREAERICELGVMGTIATIFQNTSPFFAGRLKQSADTADNARTRLEANLRVIDARLAKSKFVAGERPTIADCTLYAALEFATLGEIPIDPAFANVHRWWKAMKARPSAGA